MNSAFQQLAGREVICGALERRIWILIWTKQRESQCCFPCPLTYEEQTWILPIQWHATAIHLFNLQTHFKTPPPTALQRLVCCSVYSDIWSFENKLFNKYLYLSWILLCYTFMILLYYAHWYSLFLGQGFMCPKLTLNSPLDQGWFWTSDPPASGSKSWD